MKSEQFVQLYHGVVIFRWANDYITFVLEKKTAWLSCSFTSQSAGRYIAPLGRIILIPNQPTQL